MVSNLKYYFLYHMGLINKLFYMIFRLIEIIHSYLFNLTIICSIFNTIILLPYYFRNISFIASKTL
ncbi:hypothetical protein F4820DRAFT_246814 [Hypoxylon rubiginosum]|uniref:Uncharacterized protein n=1 Tax=Hypoxylon rubiginosum TaxID=110542 RepID=A0ACB9Z5S3_9PEZI|nr:hypothetical protein F4820DRAFT_246814 [Hypoxylon rubiginosum]